MLTKEERAAIAKRASSYNDGTFYFVDIYKCLFGEEVPDITSEDEDTTRVIGCLIDLCDTSNMLELPVDKDGKVVCPGDTVYDINNIKCEVIGYMLDINKVILRTDGRNVELLSSAESLTHKEPITTKLLAQRIKYVLENEATSIGVSPYVELGRIAEQLESLGDKDE